MKIFDFESMGHMTSKKNCGVYMEPHDKNVELSNKMLIKKYENLSNQM